MTDKQPTLTLRSPGGLEKETKVSPAGKVTCPECGAKAPDRVDIHTLNRVLAGECVACFHTWAIGVTDSWEVVE